LLVAFFAASSGSSRHPRHASEGSVARRLLRRQDQLIDYLAATPGTVSVQIKQGLAEMAEACQDIWYAGAKGETLRFERAE
jgi:hypothetical protein